MITQAEIQEGGGAVEAQGEGPTSYPLREAAAPSPLLSLHDLLNQEVIAALALPGSSPG